MKTMAASFRLAVAMKCVLMLASVCQGLHVGYYKKTCPQVEAIVRDEVKKFVYRDAGIGAGLIRLLFHTTASFRQPKQYERGCDGSVLLDPTPANPQPEKLSPPNNPSLRGFEVIDAAKDAVEKACPGKVSCADIVAFAARDASYFLSSSAEALNDLPPPFFNLSQLVSSFAAKGLTAEDMVVLSGAHTIGRSPLLLLRLRPPRRAVRHQRRVRQHPQEDVPGQPDSGQRPHREPGRRDTQRAGQPDYKNVLAKKVLFTSDAALMTSPATAKMVQDNAFISGLWEDKFKKAFVKMAGIGVKTGSQGEIRKHCRLVN
ncbi:hypothetical protein EJB05_06477, partial [Eragrostis curvula]